MAYLLGLMFPLVSGLVFGYWSWWIFPIFMEDNRTNFPNFLNIRGIIIFIDVLQFFVWTFVQGTLAGLIVIIIVFFCGILQYLCLLGDRYALGSRHFSLVQLKRLSFIMVALVSLCCFSVIIALGFFLRFLGAWQPKMSIGFLIGMFALYVTMIGVMAMVIGIKDRKEKKFR